MAKACEDGRICEECEEDAENESDIFRCQKCAMNVLCKDCANFNHFKKKHDVVDFRGFEPSTCENHRKIAYFFCQDCSVFCCNIFNCMQTHQSHNYGSIHKIAGENKKLIFERTSSLEKLIKPMNQSEDDLKSLQKNFQQMKQTIEKEYNVSAIMRFILPIIESVVNENIRKMAEFEKQIEDISTQVKSQKDELNSSVNFWFSKLAESDGCLSQLTEELQEKESTFTSWTFSELDLKVLQKDLSIEIRGILCSYIPKLVAPKCNKYILSTKFGKKFNSLAEATNQLVSEGFRLDPHLVCISGKELVAILSGGSRLAMLDLVDNAFKCSAGPSNEKSNKAKVKNIVRSVNSKDIYFQLGDTVFRSADMENFDFHCKVKLNYTLGCARENVLYFRNGTRSFMLSSFSGVILKVINTKWVRVDDIYCSEEGIVYCCQHEVGREYGLESEAIILSSVNKHYPADVEGCVNALTVTPILISEKYVRFLYCGIFSDGPTFSVREFSKDLDETNFESLNSGRNLCEHEFRYMGLINESQKLVGVTATPEIIIIDI